MSWQTFDRLAPAFQAARLVHLQGWGEPLLNPRLGEMIRAAKRAGCRVGLTTNGSMLDRAGVARLLEVAPDIVALSLAGTGRANERLRPGTSLDVVENAVRELHRQKTERRMTTPALHIAYLLTRSNLDELDHLERWLADLPVDEVVVSTLDLVACPELSGEAVHPGTEAEYARLHGRLDVVREAAAVRGVAVHSRLPRPGRPGPCSENVARAVFVAASGDVSPCVFTNLPVDDEKETCVRGAHERPLSRLVFGNVTASPLGAIWNSPAYTEFRRAAADGDPPPPCVDCPKRFVRW
jgi:MoaA/NifB/PqqE/SkfB family radical SAM enzyme